MDQLAVQDLVALADVLLMPEDDLALAVVLKSPLFGLDDDALFDSRVSTARARCGRSSRPRREDDPRFAEAAERLAAPGCPAPTSSRLTSSSRSCSATTASTMRKRMLTRLGPEAAEAIDEFLDLALAYDRDAAPSLQGFVNQLRASDVEIKRDMEQDRDEVRIMTVHGAKGLQAPIVFLPDTCMVPRAQGPRIYPLPRPGSPAGHGRPSRLAAHGTLRPRGARRRQDRGAAGRARGISPAALCRHDAGARPALCLRLAGRAGSARRTAGTTSSTSGLHGHLTEARP